MNKSLSKDASGPRRTILVATTNAGKIMTAKKILAKLGYDAVTFEDLGIKLLEPDETLDSAEAIAREKALGYAGQFRDFPVLARDDTSLLVGVDDEDDPKNHNKEFVIRRAGRYTDELGTKVFADVARKYGGEVPLEFHWGYALAWWENEELGVTSGLAIKREMKIVDQISPKTVAGFSFSPVTKVHVGGEWKYDSELTEVENWEAYWSIQADVISELIGRCPLLSK